MRFPACTTCWLPKQKVHDRSRWPKQISPCRQRYQYFTGCCNISSVLYFVFVNNLNHYPLFLQHLAFSLTVDLIRQPVLDHGLLLSSSYFIWVIYIYMFFTLRIQSFYHFEGKKTTKTHFSTARMQWVIVHSSSSLM